MDYVKYDPEFWENVSIALCEAFGLHGEDNRLDPETLYVLAKTVKLGCNEQGVCFMGRGGWDPGYTADRLHRRLGLR